MPRFRTRTTRASCAPGSTTWARTSPGLKTQRATSSRYSRMPELNATLEPWQWHEETWRGHVQHVRAGRSLAPVSWPGGATVAVALSFDSDHETIPLRDGETSPGKLSQGEFGSRGGAPPTMRLLAAKGVRATCFMPACPPCHHHA